ncbi:MAG: BolA/IbaG family iron-sulfur metabolism protein [Mariprofundales bacterium]
MLNKTEMITLLQQRVLAKLPDAQVDVHAYKGNDHFKMQVSSASFIGTSRVQQHQMVYQALGELMQQQVHALALTTTIPKENNNE